MRRIARWLLVLALSLSIGLQWAVVQGAAWVGMILSFSKEATITQSVAMTFDGVHPCSLCKAAQKGDSTQKKQDADSGFIKLVLAAPEAEDFVFAEGVLLPGGRLETMVISTGQPPASPPPEAA